MRVRNSDDISPSDTTDSARNLIAQNLTNSQNDTPNEWWKTAIMFIYSLVCMFLMTIAQTIGPVLHKN